MIKYYFTLGKKVVGHTFTKDTIIEEMDHQKKVIDRLSRKIQRIKKERNQNYLTIDSYKRAITFKESYNLDLINRLFEAYNFINKCGDCLSVKEVAELKEILKGSDIK